MTTLSPNRYTSPILFILALLLAFLLAVPAGAQGEAISSDTRPEQHDDNSPVRVVVSMDRLPPLGETATLQCRVFSVIDAPHMVAQLELPPGAIVQSGSLQWEGDLQAGETIEFSAEVAFAALGDAAVRCRANSQLDESNSVGDLEAIYFSVGETVTERGFAPRSEVTRLIGEPAIADATGELAGLPDLSELESLPGLDAPLPPAGGIDARAERARRPAAPAPAAPEGTVTVSGRWRYYDRSDTPIGAYEMLVELVNGDTYAHLAWCWTNSGGYYTCPSVTNPGSQGLRTRLHSYTCYNNDNAGCNRLIVKDPANSGNNASDAYRWISVKQVLADGAQDIGSYTVPIDWDSKRALWSVRDLIDTWRFIWFNGGGGTSGGAGSAGPSVVLWTIDSTDGTYFALNGDQYVHLAGDDPISDTTVIHEYAHNIMYNVYVLHLGSSYPSFPNCNPHFIQLASSQGCAWTEGWAEFIPSVVNNDPTYRWSSGASLNLENPTWTTLNWDDGDDVEGRVVGALWDIYDSANEGDDQYTEVTSPRFFPFWDIFWDQTDSNMYFHWSAWRTAGYNNSSAGPLMSMYQSTINYRTGPANDDFANAAVVGSLPYTVNNLYTTNATTQGNDPAQPGTCGYGTGHKQARSVWYRYNPTITAQYSIHTNGSDYDTVLSVWTGSFGALNNVACDDDGGSGTQSDLDVILNSGTNYYIEVMGYGPNSNGGYMDLSITINPPIAPTNLTATANDPLAAPTGPESTATADDEGLVPLPQAPAAPDAAQITLEWSDNSVDETNFHVEKWNGASYAEVAFVVGTSWSDGNVSPGGTYWYRVRGHRHSDDAYSGYSNVASASIPELPVGPAVTIAPSGDNALLLWSYLSQNTAGYAIWESAAPYFTPGAGGSTLLDSVDAVTTNYSHSGALLGGVHFYYVVGENAIGQTATSNHVGVYSVSLTPGN